MRTISFLRNFSTWIIPGLILMFTLNSCSEDPKEEPENPVASFQFAISETNYLEVSFTNFSQNATSYTWDFGDGESSVEINPVHTYTTAGSYTVKLTAMNSADVTHEYSQSIEITDPNVQLALLAGETSKTWKLYREGTSMGVGPDQAGARSWWALENDGSRPCVYKHEFTFTRDGSFVFDDNDVFWGEAAVFDGAKKEVCFEAIPANMINSDGADISAWLSGTHQFTYDPATNKITLTGNGAWMGIPHLGTTAESIVPVESKTFTAILEEKEGFDLLTISYAYAELYWDFTYASYDNPADEPDLVEEAEPFGEDLPDLTPTDMYFTFASASDKAVLDTSASGTQITLGVDDPAGGDTKVGEYYRTTDQYQELQFKLANDIIFSNFTTVSVDVYVPASNTYSEGGLTKAISIGIAETSQTEQWWNGHIQYDVAADTVPVDTWKTYTFQLDSPTSGPGMGNYTPFSRNDLDMIFISIGGSGHTVDGTFYVRNLKFE